jgi:hypothetical protein
LKQKIFKGRSAAVMVSAFVFAMAMVPGKSLGQVTSITLNSLSTGTVCAGTTLDVDFSNVATGGPYDYIVQLSDNTGSFVSPTDFKQILMSLIIQTTKYLL